QTEHVTRQSNGCIAWNQQLNHTRVDIALNRQTRPMQIDTRRWSVASILSKKYCAGATHVVIDIPYGPHGKVGTLHEAQALADVFTDVGQHLGMVVKAFPTPGHSPIGRGIGPALEAADVMQVLNRSPQAPSDLREKSLFFAAQ